MNMRSTAIGIMMMLMLPVVSMGQTSTPNTIADLQAQIQALLEQLQTLQQQILATQQEVKETRKELRTVVKEFRTQLRQGIRNGEVTLLQELLATDEGVYPEGLVTGYFGSLTRQAVIRFQIKHGIEGVGEVGPQTRRALNAFIKKDLRGDTISDRLLEKFNTEGDENHDAATSTDDGRGRALGKMKIRICKVPPGNPAAAHTITIAAPALNVHLAQGSTLGACNDEDETEEPADITAPVLSNVAATTTTASTTRITWTTDEEATSKVWYATSTPVDTSSASLGSSASFVTNHDIMLSNLTASTTYYYLTESEDETGNTSTSSESSFTTN